jgi:hypothetical protein
VTHRRIQSARPFSITSQAWRKWGKGFEKKDKKAKYPVFNLAAFVYIERVSFAFLRGDDHFF